jgi:hypothetical protein
MNCVNIEIIRVKGKLDKGKNAGSDSSLESDGPYYPFDKEEYVR